MNRMLVMPPQLFDPETGTPPGDSWDVQVVAPPAYIAWLAGQARRRRGATAGLAAYEPARAQALATIGVALPEVPLTGVFHERVAWSRDPHPHLHVFVAATDRHGEPVARELLDEVGAAAWVAQVDRLMDVTDADPTLGIRWTRDGIEGVSHRQVLDDVCFGLYGPFQAILACP